MKVVGLTGGIGTGKSTVSNYLRERGFPILDADQIARDIVEPGSDTLSEIATAFGDVLKRDGSLDRKKLAQIVFSDCKKKDILDSITHKRILELIHSQLEAYRKKGEALVFIDAPLFFEAGLDTAVDETWVVDADDDIRISRVEERDGISREDIEKRIAMQMSREEKRRRAQVVLDNSGSVEELYAQVKRLLPK